MPAEDTAPIEPTETPAPAADFAKQLVDEVRAGLAATAPPAATSTTDPAAEARARADAKLEAATNRFDELVAEGKAGEGMKHVMAAVNEAQQITASAHDPSTSPVAIGLAEQATILLEQREGDMFEHYGAEIREAIASLPIADRVTLTGQSTAVDRVRMRHGAEIQKRAVDTAVAEEIERRSQAAPGHAANVPIPDLGESDDTELHGLSADDRRIASDLGVTYGQYAAQLKYEETQRNKDGSVDILPRMTAHNPIQPGKF